ncbi:hypothetical protein DIE19_35465, partial [Burkholderia sp. Bp9126]
MNHQALSSFIWSVADLLRGDYKQSEYGRVIRKHPAKTPLGVNCRQSSGDGCPTMRQQRGDVVGAVGRQAI